MADIFPRVGRRVNEPPPTEDPALDAWMQDVADALNQIPPMSSFSATTPNSNVTAEPGHLAINLSPSATTIMWYKQSGSSNIGWDSLATSNVSII